MFYLIAIQRCQTVSSTHQKASVKHFAAWTIFSSSDKLGFTFIPFGLKIIDPIPRLGVQKEKDATGILRLIHDMTIIRKREGTFRPD